ncbi:hypothetical protein SOCE836_028960 [Sorangium cellulosum]|uniref:Secreted protein n=1 Tax=Sorangium cellulosum TaxID=56 RepID=A0A4P2QMP6_SORCE|nr:hypothetical protein SOCE836_028960 [Sorangium cellulosum]WCQ90164.1 hypothetical protein NQZ70_02865 [Sorangium sp. Soce836]
MLRAAVRAARPRFARFATALARSLGAAALAASATGCLVISPPEYDHAERTPPVLTAVFPPPHRPVHIDQMDKIQDFSATVLSEDNGDPVEVYMYIDYGKLTSDKYPYRRRVQQDSVSAGTIAGGQRPLRARLDLNIDSLPDDATTPERECHTITVMASHAFNTKKCSCPDDPDDMSWITWQIINCDPNEPTCPTSCPALNCEATQCLFCDDPSIETKCANP